MDEVRNIYHACLPYSLLPGFTDGAFIFLLLLYPLNQFTLGQSKEIHRQIRD
jgi:hypothetical protein